MGGRLLGVKVVSARMANHNLIAFAMTVTTAAIADRMRLSPPAMFGADGLLGSHRLALAGLTNRALRSKLISVAICAVLGSLGALC
jgi:hypothetical protein